MNPGYISYVLIICFLILNLSGWCLELTGQTSSRKVTVFLISWLLVIPLDWQVSSGLKLNAGMLFVGVIVIAVLTSIRSSRQLMMLFLISVVVAIWYGFLAYTHRWSSYDLIYPIVYLALGGAIITAWFLHRPLQQFTALSLGLSLGIWLEQIFSGASILRFGQATLQDELLLSFFLVRIISILVQWSKTRVS